MGIQLLIRKPDFLDDSTLNTARSVLTNAARVRSAELDRFARSAISCEFALYERSASSALPNSTDLTEGQCRVYIGLHFLGNRDKSK